MPKRQALEDHLAADAAQLEQRRRLGDDLASPREVEHFAYFSRKADARHAAVALEAAGYRVDTERHWLTTMVRTRRDSDVLPETVERTTRRMVETIEMGGGTYDGWGGTIVPGT